jgi:hypothetical protein
MRQNRFNISTGVIEVNFPTTLTPDDVQDFRDAMAITFRVMERIATNGHRQEGETTSKPNISN